MACPSCGHLFLEHDKYGCKHSACECHTTAEQITDPEKSPVLVMEAQYIRRFLICPVGLSNDEARWVRDYLADKSNKKRIQKQSIAMVLLGIGALALLAFLFDPVYYARTPHSWWGFSGSIMLAGYGVLLLNGVRAYSSRQLNP